MSDIVNQLKSGKAIRINYRHADCCDNCERVSSRVRENMFGAPYNFCHKHGMEVFGFFVCDDFEMGGEE